MATSSSPSPSPSHPLWQRLFSLEGKSALITGASSGLGRAMALAFAEAGASVGIHGRDRDRVEATCAEIRRAGGNAAPLLADVREVSDCRRLIEDAHAALGRLDILVNNAGMNRRKPIADVTEEDYETITNVNLRSVYFLSQAAHATMRAQGSGKVIHVGSITSYWGLGEVSVYGLTKSALVQFTKVSAVEWARDNVQVNCLIPGFYRTPLTEAGLWQHEQRSGWLLDRIPAGRAGEPEELVGAALLLASPASDYMTGSTVTVDGGFLAGGWWDHAV